MILDRLENLDRYAGVHPGLDLAFAFLRRPELSSLRHGRYEVDGQRVFAIIDREASRGREAARLEAHRKYIDVRFIIEGTDEVGWEATARCRSLATSYDPATDLVFFQDVPALWLPLPAGTVAVYFPHDAHAPLAGQGVLHKVVVKVAVYPE